MAMTSATITTKGKPYQFTRQQISTALETMFASPTFEFENRSAVYQALQRMKVRKADFSDYLIGALSRQAGCSTTYSFDRKLIEEKDFTYPIL